jgi:hypothetical protein
MDASITYRTDTGEMVDSPLSSVDSAAVFAGRPIRTPASYRGQRHYPGEYWTATTGSHVLYESRLELLRLQLADFDPTVSAIAAQPFCLAYTDRRCATRKHIPDYLLRRRNGEIVVVNVKPPDWPRRARAPHHPDFTAIATALAARGWDHELWTGVDAALAANVRLLSGYRRPWTVDDGVVADALRAHRAGDTIAALEARLNDRYHPQVIRPALLHAMWCQQLRADLTAPLGGDTPLERSATER